MKRCKRKSKAEIRLSGTPILSMICKPVEPDEDIDHITRDMSHILTQSKTGVGLSANQAGYLKRVIIMNYPTFQILTNPEIVYVSKEVEIKEEGCLSYPGIFVDIERYKSIHLMCDEWSGCREYFDFPARIIQHEIDHLDGKCKVNENRRLK